MIAVITGGSKGIGLAIAKKFFSEGYNVLTCSRSSSNLKDASKVFEKMQGGTFDYMVADLSVKADVQGFADWVLQKGIPAILVNNAGTYLPGDCMTEADGSLEAMMAANLYSAYHLTKKFLPGMTEKQAGHIFNICSIASLKAYPGGGAYSISKFALHGFTMNLRRELLAHNIKVTGVYPGAVLTDSWEGFDNSTHRIMETDDVA
ncbi:MAG: SDR family oxidoreductase, partial [Chitinophagaceae bacterium]